MRAILLAATVAIAAFIPAAPAGAQSFAAFGSNGGHHRSDSRGISDGGFGRLQGCDSIGGSRSDRRGRGDGDRDGRRVRVHRGGSCNISVGTWVDGGEWALYNNRTFAPDSYNDWWHDNPDRAFPRWVRNGDCARQWYAGDTLRC